MQIKEFAVEVWMNAQEQRCKYNLAETCVESLTVQQLLEISGKTTQSLEELLPMKLTYGDIEGSERLRAAAAALYSNQTKDNILITHGAIGANALVYQALIEPGDRVISVLPTYQQHYSIPEGWCLADVRILRLREENGFLPDLQELRALADGKAKLIAINNPNNPTGALMDEAFLQHVVEIARSVGAYLLCDEVYRGVNQEGDGFTASVADLYEKGISTCSMSKSFSLAGLRLGWIAAPTVVLQAVSTQRDYNTISVGMLDDHFACMALESRKAILARSCNIVRTNLAFLDKWVAAESLISYVKPKAATVALLKYHIDMPSQEFCLQLLEATGVMFTPGSAFDMEGYVRIGFANSTHILQEGLAKVSEFLARFPAA